MSTDWSIACPVCRVSCHLGQSFTSGPSLGFGSDDRETPLKVAAFIDHHLTECEKPLIVVQSDSDVLDGYKDLTDA